MAVIKKVGAPTRTTKGAVGDTYIDLKERKAYGCVSAYQSTTGSVDYVWRAKEDLVEEDVEAEVKEAPTPEPQVEEQVNDRPNKHNYNKQYNKR